MAVVGMKPRRIAVAVVVALVAATALAPAGARTPMADEGLYAPDRVLIRFAPGVDRAIERNVVRALRGRVYLRSDASRMTAVTIGRGLSVPAAISILRRSPFVEVAEPDWLGRIATHGYALPDDPCVVGCSVGRQWNLRAINAIGGWQVYPGHFPNGAQRMTMDLLKVAVLDTKIDTRMRDWINAGTPPTGRPEDSAMGGQLDLENAKDFVPITDQQGPLDYHGTFVAGIIGAAVNNTVGIAGVAASVKLMPVTVVDGRGVAAASHVAAGIDWAVERGARVINASFGLREDSTFVRQAVARAFAADRIVVAAAGNFGNDQPFYPAWYPGAMSVTAVGEDDRPGRCTNFSTHTSVAAPGVGIVSLDPRAPDHLRKEVCGTSTAAPHVSALAALLYQQRIDRGLTPTAPDIKNTIERTADDSWAEFYPGKDPFYGNGRINVERALREIDRDGLAEVIQIQTTFPRPQGGVSHATAIAFAWSERPLLGGEWFLDHLGAPGTGRAIQTWDDDWGKDLVAIQADVEAPLSIETGVHHLFMRVRSDLGWGPASVGVLIVDRIAPLITDLTATPGSGIAVSSIRRPLTVSFSTTDDFATSGTWRFIVTRNVGGQTQTLYTSPQEAFSFPATLSGQWQPSLASTGPVNITVEVTDQAGNVGRRTTSSVIA